MDDVYLLGIEVFCLEKRLGSQLMAYKNSSTERDTGTLKHSRLLCSGVSHV
jgi:hypothetical protein